LEQVILNVEPREKTAKKFKEEGYVPAVIYGNGSEPKSVKIPEMSLKKMLAVHGQNVKLWVECGEDKKFGFIKEIQRQPVTNKIRHIDIQLVARDKDVKIQIPIIFDGEEALKKIQLQLQIRKAIVEVFGKIDLMPDVIHVDVSKKERNDTITFEEFKLDSSLKSSDNEDEVYGTITSFIIEEEEEEEVVAPVAPVAADAAAPVTPAK
jgi:large subunit ribosomal protein L25